MFLFLLVFLNLFFNCIFPITIYPQNVLIMVNRKEWGTIVLTNVLVTALQMGGALQHLRAGLFPSPTQTSIDPKFPARPPLVDPPGGFIIP